MIDEIHTWVDESISIYCLDRCNAEFKRDLKSPKTSHL